MTFFSFREVFVTSAGNNAIPLPGNTRLFGCVLLIGKFVCASGSETFTLRN